MLINSTISTVSNNNSLNLPFIDVSDFGGLAYPSGTLTHPLFLKMFQIPKMKSGIDPASAPGPYA